MFANFKIERQKKQYSKEVKQYFDANRHIFLLKWSSLCESKHGRITYAEMGGALGRNFPKAPWIDKNDKKKQIITFLKEIGLMFKADDTHLYFP